MQNEIGAPAAAPHLDEQRHAVHPYPVTDNNGLLARKQRKLLIV